MTAVPILPLSRYCIRFRAVSDLPLPAFTGAAWRGGFNHALKRLVCVTREPTCPPCLLYRTCIYPYLFETPPHPGGGKLARCAAAPHPFVLIPDQRSGAMAAGETLTLGITLFGNSNRHLPYIVQALNQAGQRGIGQDRGILELLTVSQIDENDRSLVFPADSVFAPTAITATSIPPCPEQLRLHLVTPLRLNSENHLVSQDRFHFYPLFSSLLRRISLLMAFHTDALLEADFAGLTQAARRVELDHARLRWHEWARYSSRQDRLVQMGGLLGDIELSGKELEPFWPYLWLGQWAHAGKGAVMGLGRYQVHFL